MFAPNKTLLAACLILALIGLSYSNSFHGAFQFDDNYKIATNPDIRKLKNVRAFFYKGEDGSNLLRSKEFRPVSYATLAVNYALSAYRTWSYHLLNFLLHFINSLMVFLIVKAVLEKAGHGSAYGTALVASLLFALHPLQTSAVMYLSNGRDVLLASLFFLLALYSFLAFRTRMGRSRYVFGVLAPIFFLLAMSSKEIAVALIAVIVCYDLAFPGSGPKRRAALYYLPFIAALAFFIYWKKSLHGYIAVRENPYSVPVYLMSEAKAFLLYIRLLFLPVNMNADRWISPTTGIDAWVIASVVLAAAAIFLLLRARRKYPAAFFFGSWFFLALSPESTFVSFRDIAVEYRLYLPSVGFIALFVLLLERSLKVAAVRRALPAGLMALFMVLTFNRNKVWATEYTFWSDVARKSPLSPRAHHNLGCVLTDMRRYNEGLSELGLALELDPTYPQRYRAYNCMGGCYYGLGMYQEAAKVLEKTVADFPGFAEGHSNLAQSYAKLGRFSDELWEMEDALKIAPRDFLIRYNLSVAYFNNKMYYRALEEAGAALSLARDKDERERAEVFLAKVRSARQLHETNGGLR